MCQTEYRGELKRVQLPTLWTIPDQMWRRIRPLLPTEKEPDTPGRPPVPFRKVMNGVLFVLRTGCHWGRLFLVATAPVRPPTAASRAVGGLRDHRRYREDDDRLV
jgi:hypothetical protein